jgi:hypothetical protein
MRVPCKPLVLVSVAATVLVAGCGMSSLAPDVRTVREVQGQPYSDQDWAAVLRDHVRYGLVDYDTLRAHPESLLRYCAIISVIGPTRTPDQFPSKSHATAYYINAYNALVLRAVLSRPADVPTMYDYALPQLEFDYHFTLDGLSVTLAEIEASMLRSSNGDVRTLLATSRASMGTPRLPSEPIRAETLERQLAQAASEALDLPEVLSVDHSTRTIQVWQLILRRRNDFIEYWKTQRRVRTAYLFNVLLEMASPQKRRALQSAVGYEFREIAFDRTLNRWERRADRPAFP